jgi:hypothetical protein
MTTNCRLLLQPMQYIPAIDGALTQLVTSLHDVVKHDIAGKECESTGLDTRSPRGDLN